MPEFRSAELNYMVANTPTFLARKLREDEDVQKFARNVSSTAIIDAIKKLTTHPPTDLREKYLPLVLLGALSAKGDRSALRSASEFDRGTIRWYHEILEYLIQVTPADNRVALDDKARPHTPLPQITKTSSNTIRLWT